MATRSLMDFQTPRIVHEEINENRGVFVIEPLDRGFGYTFGNSLRRVLLSSLEGAAVTSVKLEGVQHEFSNLADKGRLDLTLTIGRGRGYVPSENNRGPEHTIGVIPIDSMFSPVRRVSYDVEAARVGQRTDYDKLRLDVTTDGSLSPKDAIGQAAEILIRQLAIFTDLERIEGFGEAAAAAEAEASQAHGMENFPIEELELGARSYNCLKRVGIETIGDLVTKSEA